MAKSDALSLLDHMVADKHVQSMDIADRDYNALKRAKLLVSIYSMPDDGISERKRFFHLTEKGAALAGSAITIAPITVVPSRIPLRLKGDS